MALAFVFLITVCAYAHPGKTDYHGGHKCWKGCGEWGLEHEEYHLHDKDWKPIRLDRNGKPAIKHDDIKVATGQEPAVQNQIAGTTSDKINGTPKVDIKRINIFDRNTIIYEESILSFNVILLLLLALLLLTVLIFIRKRK